MKVDASQHLLTVKKAALTLGVERWRIYELIACGKLNRVMRGRLTRIRRIDLDRLQAAT